MATATLSTHSISDGYVEIPRHGAWTAWVRVVHPEDAPLLAGIQTLSVGSLALSGFIVDGAVRQSVATYRLVGGRGGWRKTIPSKGYSDGAGVKLGTIMRDAASACGEQLATFVDKRIPGDGWSRPEGPASTALELLVAESWYVNEAGITVIGSRPSLASSVKVQTVVEFSDLRVLAVDAENLAAIVPGVILAGDFEAATVRHEITPESLRCTVWRRREGISDSVSGVLRRLVRVLKSETRYHSSYEYRVTRVGDGYLDLVPVRSHGLPSLSYTAMWSGVPGASGEPLPGSSVLVSFIDGDPARAFVSHFVGPSGELRIPSSLVIDALDISIGGSALSISLGGSTIPLGPGDYIGRVLRYGDTVLHPITPGAPFILAAPPTMLPASTVKGL